METNKSRVFARLGILTFIVALVAPLAVSAATVTNGSLALGDPRPSALTTYTFSGSGFSSGVTINCIRIRINTAADGSGSTPSGFSVASATLGTSTLVSGWSTNGSTGGTLEMTDVTGSTPAGSGTIVFNNVANGSLADTTYYALLNTYSNTNCSTGPVDSTVVAFMYKDGALVSLTVEPSLVFTVAGVDDAETVNGATTTLTSTATAIDFSNDVTVAAKGVSAHDVTVGTNGSGFTVHLRQSTIFSNGTHTITPWTGTNGTPTTFPAAGTEAWGYTTDDNDLLTGGGATRFTSASNWAGMSTTNQLVGDLGTAGSDTIRVGHQLGITGTTPSGNYSTTLVYTAAGSY